VGRRVSRALTPEQKLHKKLFDARKAAEAVAKKGDGGEFDFARFEDVMNEASRLLDEKRILIVPSVVEEALRLQSRFAVAKVAMEFEVIDLSTGHSIKKRWSGTADDEPGGKALFKAQTGCEKYFLAKLLRIPFGNDPETIERPSAEAQRVAEEQDRTAEEPQAPRYLKPVPQSDLPEPDWSGLGGPADLDSEPANV
jgi:hypothetical protein